MEVPNTIRLEFTLALYSDFHVGTGYGAKGVADSKQRVDEQGRPVVPKRQFRGLVRDRLEHIASLYPGALNVCDGEYTGAGRRLCGVNYRLEEDPCPICRIFGSPFTPRGFEFADVRVAPEDAPEYVPVAVAASRADRELFPQPHVSIDPDTGRARDDHLFGIEVARPQDALSSAIEELPDHQSHSPESRREDAVLLVAALLFLRRVGGKRRRGLGRCAVVFPDDQALGEPLAELIGRQLPLILSPGGEAQCEATV